MTEAVGKTVMATEVFLLLVPLTLFVALLMPLSYIAYPIPEWKLIQIVFDLGMLIKLGGIIAAWRLAVLYLRDGHKGVCSAGAVWIVFLVSAALIGLLSTIVAIEQLLANFPSRRIGFTLLAPAAALLPITAHLLWALRQRA